ncbi:MAG: phosphotransferase family protein [bacterium]|nr:phosphotransferase family protein [bacterium]
MSSSPEIKGIEIDRVSEWFLEHVPGIRTPLRFEPIVGGHSNLTYKVSASDGELYVLRRPPLGAVLATAHDMAREHRIVSAVEATDVPVPETIGLCGDEAVNGAPFYVMKFVHGHVLTDRSMAEKHFDPAQRGRIGRSMAEVLARLHRVDPVEIGLGNLARTDSYLARQLKRWSTQWANSKTRDLPDMEEAYELLVSNIPEQKGVAIAHGDYRLGNCLIGEDARIAAVLDWELCTLGDPLADVGYLMNDWRAPGEIDRIGQIATSASTSSGFPDREEMLRIYSETSGIEVGDVSYYRAFQYWRSGAIVEGVLARYLKGVMGNEADTAAFRLQVDGVAAAAVELLRAR